MLTGKKILLGVCGSIAAYKSAFLVRELVKAGAEVKVVMTSSASAFITPLTLSTLSKNSTLTDFIRDKEGTWNNHVELGLWADVMVIAPASANTIAKMANGLCDNLLLAVYLSARCPVFFAPAMDHDMFLHPSVKANIKKLESFGNILIAPSTGELASGLFGEGRMAEPEEIADVLHNHFNKNINTSLEGKTVLITAGPTYEAIDPVRFIGNHSSGKMGFALAEEAAKRGANVILVTGPTHQQTQNPAIKRVDVSAAAEMYDACTKYFDKVDVAILSAAVADYKAKEAAPNKIKKQDSALVLELEPTRDILAELGKRKQHQLLVGFALETENELHHAEQKLKRKNLDMIVLNSLNDKGAGFKTDTNKITILDKYNKPAAFELKSKEAVAADIFDHINTLLSA